MHGASVFLLLLMEESKMWAILPKPWPLGPPQVRPDTQGVWWDSFPSATQGLFPSHPFVHSHDGLPPGCYH